MDKRPEILIVDDSKTNRAVLRGIFKQNYELVEAEDGEIAIQVLESHPDIALILLDINMPRMNGYELLAYLQQDSQLSNIPVVIDTEFGDEESELKALKLGAMDFLTKPYNPEIVLHRVQNVMAKLQLEQQHTEQRMNEKQIKELRYQAEHDLMTGIYQRETFYTKTVAMLHANTDIKYMLIQWDIERFKVINDLYGTDVGDAVLIGIARTFDDIVLGIGTYGRLTADNFVCCVPKDRISVEQLLKQFEKSFCRLQLNYQISLYAGVYDIHNIEVPIDQMCDRACLALRTIKGNYMKHYAMYDNKLRETMLEEQYIVSEMQSALEEHQFDIYLQPIYNIASEQVVSAEALVRWHHPDKGMIMPGLFIPLFERNGFITKLDAYVWERTCQYLKKRKTEGKKEIPISVNVSRMNLYNPNFCEDMIALLQKYHLDARALKLEITESAYIDNARQLLETMGKLQEYGFKILTDDFGSGYSSLNMLKDVPADILKIDMKFIDDLEHSDRAGNILTSVIRMAKWLDMSVVAEGVETKRQFEFLRSIECDDVQGYYFSRPLPIDQFEALVD
ncbi:MAG: EAL domain-containing protein [Lachnospiraceae bacterium]